MFRYIRRLLFAVMFSILDRITRRDREDVMVRVRYSILDADIKPLLDHLVETVDGTVYVCTSKEDSRAVAEEIQTVYDNQLQHVEPDSLQFLNYLSSCRLVVLQGPHHLHGYHFLWKKSKRSCVLFYHGIITKSYRRHTQEVPPAKIQKLKTSLLEEFLHTGIDVQSVASEVESFFRSSAENRHPSSFRQFGYPRYDRVAELLSDDPQPTPDYVEIDELTTEHKTILYAPTHKDHVYQTTPFPFENFELDRLRSFLREQNARLFLRMHPSEEESGIYEEYIDNQTIFYAGQDRSFSSIEILPYIDVLVTDYSSIYMDFLPFDRPIVFVTDHHDKFLEQRGISFDRDRYFPGETVDSTSEFFDHLEQCLSGEEKYGNDREFVRQVLLPEWKQSTVSKLSAYADASSGTKE